MKKFKTLMLVLLLFGIMAQPAIASPIYNTPQPTMQGNQPVFYTAPSSTNENFNAQMIRAYTENTAQLYTNTNFYQLSDKDRFEIINNLKAYMNYMARYGVIVHLDFTQDGKPVPQEEKKPSTVVITQGNGNNIAVGSPQNTTNTTTTTTNTATTYQNFIQ